MKCNNCGAPVELNSGVCPYCKVMLSAAPPENREPNKSRDDGGGQQVLIDSTPADNAADRPQGAKQDKKVNPGLIWTVSILIALLFGALGVLLIVRPQQIADDSLPDALRIGLGIALCLGAVLLVVPRVAWVGALLLVAILVGVIALLAYQHKIEQAAIPAMFVVSLGTLAYIRRPGPRAP